MSRADIVIPSGCPASAADLTPLSGVLLSAPLEYLASEHARQRCVCAYVNKMASDRRVSAADAAALITFMTCDLRLHHDDEDRDLFPLLRRRAHPEDGLESILDRLSADHEFIEPVVDDIVGALARQRGKSSISLDKTSTKAMTSYAGSMLQHLSIGSSVVLVIARKRLTAGDLKSISRGMIARRGALADV